MKTSNTVALLLMGYALLLMTAHLMLLVYDRLDTDVLDVSWHDMPKTWLEKHGES